MKVEGCDVLVSAAAGSGKTATLTERIIRSLTELTPDGQHKGDISRMLIVTFTRAAAAELRARISTALSEAIAARPNDKYLYRQLIALGSARICTIDAFYLEPVRANFERLGLPSSFRLADDAELTPLKEQLLNRLIDDRYAASAKSIPDPDAPLDALEGNAFALAMDDLLPNRDKGDTPEILLKLYEKLIAFPEGLELLATSADRMSREAELAFADTAEGKTIIETLTAALENHKAEMQACCRIAAMEPKIKDKFGPLYAEELELVEQTLCDLQAGRWQEAGTRLNNHKFRRSPTVKGASELLPDIDEAKEARKRVKESLVDMREVYFAYGEEEMRDQLRRCARTQRMLYSLLSDYETRIREEKHRRGVLDFSDVRRYLLQLLVDKDGNPTDTARALAAQYDDVYIDEYQDIDTVQDCIFSTLGEGGKRFMVGDIKQSIYSFRGAEPSIFAGYRQKFHPIKKAEEAEGLDDCCVFMSENFRCDRDIIHFTNTVCGYAFEVCRESLDYQTADELIYSKDEKRPSYPARLVLLETPSGSTSHAENDDDDEEDGKSNKQLNPETAYIADEIARLVREERHIDGSPIRPRDVAVLMRSTKPAGDMVKALRAHGIATSYAAADSLAHHPDMTLMVNLLSVIDNPRDDVPLIGLLSAENSPFTLADLMSLRRDAKDAATSLYDDLCAAAGEDACPLTQQKKDALRAFLTRLEGWRALAATLPIDRLVRRLMAEPFLVDKVSSPALIALYDKARSYQNASFCGLYQFLPYFRRLLEDEDGLGAAGLEQSEDAVTILSIHKSKGLQFPIVFVLGCASSFNKKDGSAPIMFDRALGAAAKQYLPRTAEMSETIVRRALACRLDVKQSEEEMRLLYVAMTRAKERLYLTAKLRSLAMNAMMRADRPTRGNRYEVLSARHYLDWVLSSIAPANRRDDVTSWEVTVLNREDYKQAHPEALAPTPGEASAPLTTDPNAQFYRDILERHKTFEDPHAQLRTLPTKAAASKLRVAMLDGAWLPEEFGGEETEIKTGVSAPDVAPDALALLRHRIELMQRATPAFSDLLQSNKQASPAERGTATHLFMQHCHFARMKKEGPDAEIERLVEEQFLPRRAADIIHRKHLEAFAKSDLMPLLLSAEKIYREQHFNRFIPYARLTRNETLAAKLENYTLYVQGSIDLIIEDAAGEVWLIDYKTDHISQTGEAAVKEKLLCDHADQLAIYADAVEDLLARRPDHICIYSLPLGRLIELTENL